MTIANFSRTHKSINSLSAIIQEEMNLDAYSSALLIFGSDRRKRIKNLYCEKTGFALWYKKIEEDLFLGLREFTDEVVLLSTKELKWIVDGVECWKIKPRVETNIRGRADWPSRPASS